MITEEEDERGYLCVAGVPQGGEEHESFKDGARRRTRSDTMVETGITRAWLVSESSPVCSTHRQRSWIVTRRLAHRVVLKQECIPGWNY